MAGITFRPVSMADCLAVQQHVYSTECRNCDLNFMNLMSWRFLYGTELAFHNGWLLFRFRAAGHLAYLPPIGEGDWHDVLLELMEDAKSQGDAFRLMGVCQFSLARLNETMPEVFVYTSDRAYSDYIYKREVLSQLNGKKLQPKRNFINRFLKEHPDYQFLPLTENYFDQCLALVTLWQDKKTEIQGALTGLDERSSLNFVFDHWKDLSGLGGVLWADDRIVAFTYGAPINYDTFDVCVEKADVSYEGAFPLINRDFARSLPEQFIYINREEDLGIDGLRQAKLSYHPEIILDKYTVYLKEDNL